MTGVNTPFKAISGFNSGLHLNYRLQTDKVFSNKKKYLSGFRMLHHLRSVWDGFLDPLFRRPKLLQMAALCHRDTSSRREYLLITSRDTGRWIIPKGWPIRGLSSKETALREAWEEAGVKTGVATKDPIGTYTYQKRRSGGMAVPVETLVYAVAVDELSDQFPEASERNQKWVNAETAESLVNEPELKAIFRDQ